MSPNVVNLQKKAYKQLALKIHPDKNRDDPLAKERFQKIVEAYNILSNPEKKKIYDETGKLNALNRWKN